MILKKKYLLLFRIGDNMQINVKVEGFEGPLDLLLHLIQHLEIDIYDIPMAEITEQYMLYIHTMKELELDVASEYLVMAATLLAIKSKMLLPKQEEEIVDDIEEWEPEDPREELVTKLIEYKQFKEAAKLLKEKEAERGQIFTKPPADLSSYAKEEAPLKDLQVTVYEMIAAYHKMLRRKKLKQPLSAKIAREEIPIEEKMDEILKTLRSTGKRQKFSELFSDTGKEVIVVTFLAILELMKRNEIVAEQDENFSEIFLAVKGGA